MRAETYTRLGHRVPQRVNRVQNSVWKVSSRATSFFHAVSTSFDLDLNIQIVATWMMSIMGALADTRKS
jgi:xanthine dehydrogenase iron-sulfur cluster and FAD-binding subunit A